MSETKDVRVKALEWIDYENVGFTAKGADYRVSWFNLPDGSVKWDFHPIDWPLFGEPRFNTPEEAKVAAQADYERHILAALEPAPKPAGGEAVAWDVLNEDGDLVTTYRDERRAMEHVNSSFYQIEGMRRTVRPLYAAPPFPSTGAVDVGDLVEALEMARHELWKTGASESEGDALWHVRSALSAYERSTTDGQS